MPWNNQGGGGWQGGGGQGPWGNRPSGGGGGGGPQPPDLEDILRRIQQGARKWFQGGSSNASGGGGQGGGFGLSTGGGNRRLIVLVGAVAVAIWGLSGFYRVQPDEQGVVLRFGEWTRTTDPGLRYHLPTPIETVLTPKVTRVNRVEVGFRDTGGAGRNALRNIETESLMLTGDENIVDINFVALWVIKDAGQYLFNIRDPESTVKAVAESVMREIVGKTPIAEATTEGRGRIELGAREQMQQILDSYGAGIQVSEVQLQKVDPPSQVIDAFRDVQRAQADRERAQNEAEAFANDILPRARGEAERLLQEAEGYRQEVIARASGDAQRFTSVVAEYEKAQDVTLRRLYIETMEAVLTNMNKVIIDTDANGTGGGQGVVPYLPLPELNRRAQPSTVSTSGGGE